MRNRKTPWIIIAAVLVAVLVMCLCAYFVFWGKSYTNEQQIADLRKDTTAQGLKPGDVVIETDTSTKKKLVWNSKKKKFEPKKASTTRDTEVEASFFFAGCPWEADRKLGAGGDPGKVEGYTVEIETETEEHEFPDVRAYKPDDLIALVNSVPADLRPKCYNGRK